MKICVTFKTPDAVYDALEDLFPSKKPNYETDSWDHLSEDEMYERKAKVEEAERFLSRWVRYNETVTIEFDTEASTAVVLEAKGR